MYSHNCQALPFLGPSGANRISEDGSESLGAHVEGPFINPTKNGIHKVANIIPAASLDTLSTVYGTHLSPTLSPTGVPLPPKIKKITAAPFMIPGHPRGANGDQLAGLT